MNNRKLLTFLIFCLLMSQALGQNSLEEIIKKNAELKREVELLMEDSAKVKKSIIQFNELISNNLVLNQKLNDKLRNISPNTIEQLNLKEDSLQKVLDTIQDSINNVKSEINEKDTTISTTESELGSMKVFAELFRQQKYDNNWDYLKQRYSQVTIEKLDSLDIQKEEFRDLDNYFDYCKRISAAIANKVVFTKATDCINQGIEYQSAKDLRRAIIALLTIEKDNFEKGEYCLSSEQYKELDSLDIKLSRMNNGIKELQKIIAAINKNEEICQCRNEYNKERSIELIKHFITPIEESDYFKIHQKYFKMIPFLDNLLFSYWNELKQNPFMLPTKSEEIIMNLKAE